MRWIFLKDSLLKSQCKRHILELVQHILDTANEENLKLALEEIIFNLLTVKNLDQETGSILFYPSQPKIAAIPNSSSALTKMALMRLIGLMNCYTKNFYPLHVKMKPLYKFHVNVHLHWSFKSLTIFFKN